jgi:uncharacterized protein
MAEYFSDGLINLTANLGTARDKAAGNVYTQPRITPNELNNAYRGSWLPRKIVDIPALDATRRWRTWQADKNQIAAIEKEERRLQIREKTYQANVAARLYGGAAIYIGTDDPDPLEPLDLERIKKGGFKYATVLTRHQVHGGEVDQDISSEWYGRPMYYHLTPANGDQVKVHPSRFAQFIGAPLPAGGMVEGANEGWGDPVLLSVLEAVKQADGTAANIAGLVFEAKIDVINIPGLTKRVGIAGEEAKILKRLTLAAMAKGNNGTLILDGEEVYTQKSASFATLPDIMDRFFQAVSGAADIPMTRLFGQSPAGLSATGESDLRNYYDRVQSVQQLEMEPAMWRLDEALVRSALGSKPEELHFTWNSLWQTTDKERAEIGEITARMGKALGEARLFPEEALSQAVANALIEGGTLPGLEAAIEEFGAFPEEEEPELVQAAAMVRPVKE